MSKIIFLGTLVIFFSIGLIFSQSSIFAAECTGSATFIKSCKVSSTGDCVSETYASSPCHADNITGACVAEVQNAICGYSGGVCQLIYNSPTYKTISCGGSGGGNTGPTPTPSACTTTCVDTHQCKEISNCGGGTQGGICGYESDGITPKKWCDKRICTTVCPTSTPTVPPILPPPQPLNPTGTVSCSTTSPGPVTFTWNPVAGATSYYLRIDNLATGWAPCGSGAGYQGDYCIPNIVGTGYTINLPANSSFKWWVAAVANTTEGTQSTQVSFNTPATCPTASCQVLKAYSSLWTLMDISHLSLLRPGNLVYYCATGSASTGNFDRARFTINGVLYPDTTLVRPNSGDYCQSYVIPFGVYSFNVKSQLHHVTLGWVN